MKLQHMELIFDAIFFIIIVIGISIPFFTYAFRNKLNIKNSILKFGIFFFLNLIIVGILTLILTYWSEEISKNIILENYGFNFDGMNDSEYYQNVKSENITRITEIRNSMFGIGWPLKAIFVFLFFSLPYIFLSTLALNIIEYNKKKKELQIT